RQRAGEEREHEAAPPDQSAERTPVAFRRRGDHAVDGREEPLAMLALVPEEPGGERGREGQGVERRERDREGDRQGELLVENAGRPRKEGDRNEDRDEDDRRRDDGAGH